MLLAFFSCQGTLLAHADHIASKTPVFFIRAAIKAAQPPDYPTAMY